MIAAANSKKEDESEPASIIRYLLKAEHVSEDPEEQENSEIEEAEKFSIPFLPNKLGKTPFFEMHEENLRVLVDTMMGKI